MLQNAYLLAKIGADTAENERNFAENLPKIGNYPTGPLPYGAAAACAARGRGSGRTSSSMLQSIESTEDLHCDRMQTRACPEIEKN